MVAGKRDKVHRRQLRVVFDTNALYTDSESYLVRREVANLITASKFPDLEMQWYLPELVRHERHYQMQKKALELMPGVEKVERLLGHKLNISDQTLLDCVAKVVSQRQGELNLLPLALDYQKVNWEAIALDAAYRRRPFKEGEKEKGFRDRLIAEVFLQLVANSPKTPTTCRIVLISGDKLLKETVEALTRESTNVRVLPNLEDLKDLINTLVSQVDEGFLAAIKPKAGKLFFVPEDKSTLFYKMDIRKQLKEKFARELSEKPQGATDRNNGTWLIGAPNFLKKTGPRIQWTSRIEIETGASKDIMATHANLRSLNDLATPPNSLLLENSMYGFSAKPVQLSALGNLDLEGYQPSVTYDFTPATTTVRTHKGVDKYEVLWSADVTTDRGFRKPTIDDIKHVELLWGEAV